MSRLPPRNPGNDTTRPLTTMEHPGLGNDRRGELVFFGALLVLALLMTLKYFPGFENPAAYAGNAYQAVHPDAFPGECIE